MKLMMKRIKVLSFALCMAIVAYGQPAEYSSMNEGNYLHIAQSENKTAMTTRMMTSLTFQKNDAEQAMEFYVSLFDNARIINVHRWGPEGPGKEGSIMQATFELNGSLYMCSDSPPVHNWDFSPAVSIYVECSGQEEIEKLYERLSEGGQAAMPLNNYGFSRQFAWVIDRFGVSWQLNWQ